MRYGIVVLVCLALAGCGDFQTPTGPVTSFDKDIAGGSLSMEMSPVLQKALRGEIPPSRRRLVAPRSSGRITMTFNFAKWAAWQAEKNRCRLFLQENKFNSVELQEKRDVCLEKFRTFKKEFGQQEKDPSD